MSSSPHRPILQADASLRRYAGEYGAHVHEHAQVLIGLNGRLQLELDGRASWVDASCALIVPAGVAHGYLAQAPASVLVIDSPVRAGLDRVRRFVPPPHWKDRRRAFDASAAIDEVAGADTLLLRRPIDLAVLDASVAGELHGQWSTARLAALCQLSPQRFHARFLELTGLAPAAYVRQRRLDEAERLLRAGLSLEAVALQVGYASASALTYALRRERGVGARSLRGRK
ncbi:AraC family transcriptional regulator [Variovorax sp. J22R133]|uniref:helix-turn-helix transcriptional regulator n=1 Tax=Variovorax brevis TaxID=3053503 RepID=UPI0025760FB3|nr:AraC family transcriptional regulator [Variovorax sp. J22R133]MDM0112210.1 AraC family transcriptional regulator [Variovorax sp. J22R133]